MIWAAAKPARTLILPGEETPPAGSFDLCGHEHATEAEAIACMESLGPEWFGWVEAQRLPVQAGDFLTFYNRVAYATGGDTVDLSDMIDPADLYHRNPWTPPHRHPPRQKIRGPKR